jgi:3-(3-hydroxy-phenyl)propionate hydroxylase
MDARYQVIVVGAGPTGLSAANLLGLHGVRTLLIERNAATSDIPKGILIDDEYYRLFVKIGVAPALDVHLVPEIGVHFFSPLGFALVKVDGFITPNGYPNRSATAQPLLEAALRDNLARYPSVDVAFGTALTALEQDTRGVRATIAGRDVECDYILGCDGAHSVVRQLSGLSFEGNAIDQPHVVIDVADDPDQVRYSRFFCHPSRPGNSVPAPFGGRRFEFMLLPGDDPAAILEDANLARLVAPIRRLGEMKIIRRAVYVFHNRLVDRMRQGRVFVAGDAAHLMPPFGAQGMNSGGKDVSNLCWKLAAVLRGGAVPVLLDSYHVERHAHARAIIDLSVRIGRITNLRSWPLALLRDAAFGVANLFPPARRYFAQQRYVPRQRYADGFVLSDDRGGSFVGRMLPCPWIAGGDGPRRKLDADLGHGFALVGIGVIPDPVPWRALDPVSVSIGRPSGAMVQDHRFDAVVSVHAGQVLLVRPDRYIAAAFAPGAAATARGALDRYFTGETPMLSRAA